MRKSSCKNTPQYLRSCCSPIGQNNTKDFSAQSGGSIGRAVWKWSGKSRFPGAFSALLVNLRRFISLPDLFPLAPANRPWVSEDVIELTQKLQYINDSRLPYNYIEFIKPRPIATWPLCVCSRTVLFHDLMGNFRLQKIKSRIIYLYNILAFSSFQDE